MACDNCNCEKCMKERKYKLAQEALENWCDETGLLSGGGWSRCKVLEVMVRDSLRLIEILKRFPND